MIAINESNTINIPLNKKKRAIKRDSINGNKIDDINAIEINNTGS